MNYSGSFRTLVETKSEKYIIDQAHKARSYALQSGDYLDVIKFFDDLSPVNVAVQYMTYEIVEDRELPQAEAIAQPDQKKIVIRESVYDAAEQGDGHSRFTLAHELGHLLLHSDQPIEFPRQVGQQRHTQDSEWQADTFASNLLVPRYLLSEKDSIPTIMNRFGVGFKDAQKARNDYYIRKMMATKEP